MISFIYDFNKSIKKLEGFRIVATALINDSLNCDYKELKRMMPFINLKKSSLTNPCDRKEIK